MKQLKSISQLTDGDIIRHKGNGTGYIVTGCYGHYAIAVRQVHVTNPDEWEVMDYNKDREQLLQGGIPIAIKAGDPKVLINGTPSRMDFRIISEDNYQKLIRDKK